MIRQDTLTPFDPLTAGLFRHLLDGDGHHIDHRRWLRAVAERGFVGVCRTCGGHMRPYPPCEATVSALVWYEAMCIGCRKPVAAPGLSRETGGRYLARSSRHTEMPSGWWKTRLKALKSAATQAESQSTTR